MSAPPTLLEQPLVDEDDFTEIAADLFAAEDAEFAAFRERRKHSNILTVQDMIYMSSEPPRLRQLNLAARGLDQDLPWAQDDEESAEPGELDQMNSQLWQLQLKISQHSREMAEKAGDTTWLQMRTEHTLHALRKEAATFPFPRRWQLIRCGQHYITVASASIWTPRSADTGCDS
eukprot:3659535-Rhodomonas_salina.1